MVLLVAGEREELGQHAEALKSGNTSLRVELGHTKMEYEELLSQTAILKVANVVSCRIFSLCHLFQFVFLLVEVLEQNNTPSSFLYADTFGKRHGLKKWNFDHLFLLLIYL